MTLSEFINISTAEFNGKEWVVTIPLFDGTTGKLFASKAGNEYEAKEQAFLYLTNYFENK